MPGSPVHRYLLDGSVSRHNFNVLKEHPIFAPLKQQQQPQGFAFEEILTHQFELKSCYNEVMGSEPLYTNHGGDFVGTLDYIFYGQLRRNNNNNKEEKEDKKEKEEKEPSSHEKLEVTRVYDFVPLELVERHLGCPNIQFPSDHMSLRASLAFL